MENQQQATIKDIARMAGVSIATVDRVLHDRGKVSTKNLKAVTEAIETLNYNPNQIARALVSRKSKLKIGLVLPNVESDFWNEIILGAEQAQKDLSPFGVELISDYTYNYDLADQVKSIDRLLAEDVQGLLIVPLYDGFGNEIDHHIPEEIPYGTVIDDLPRSHRLFHIGPNDFALGGLAARLTDLYCKGSGNIVILAPNHALIETQNRISGFVSKINQEALDLNILRIVPIPGKTEKMMYDNIQERTTGCLSECPDINAFYVTNGLTEWCAAAVDQYNSVKKPIIIGHEFTSRSYDYISRGLIHAAIYQRPAQQIIRAIHMMYDYLTGSLTTVNSSIVSECSIILKENLDFSYSGGIISYGNC